MPTTSLPSRRSRVRSVLSTTLMLSGLLSLSVLGGCQTNGSTAGVVRNLPPRPSLLQPVANPQLDKSCYAPWFGVKGCKGKDVRAMLKLDNSALIEANQRLAGSGGWYDGVVKSYKAPK